MWNAIGGGVLIGWHLLTGSILFIGLSKGGFLRVRAEAEIQGLDVSKHKEKAYGFGRGTTPLPPNIPLKNGQKVNTVGMYPNETNNVMALHHPEF